MKISFGTSAVVPAALVFGLALAGPSIAQPAPVRVGMIATAPYGGNPPGGYCLDLLTAIGQRTGLRFEYSALGAAALYTALAGNTIDVMCGGAAPANERRMQGVAYTSGIYVARDAIVVRAMDTAAYTSLADLRALPANMVATIAGTGFVGRLEAAGVTGFRTYPNLMALNQALIAGEVRAVIQGGEGFAYQKQVLGQWPELRAVDTFMPSVIYNSLAVRSGDTALLGTLQAALEALKGDGTVTMLLGRWVMPPPPF